MEDGSINPFFNSEGLGEVGTDVLNAVEMNCTLSSVDLKFSCDLERGYLNS